MTITKKLILFTLLTNILIIPKQTFAQTTTDQKPDIEYFKAVITDIENITEQNEGNITENKQILKVKILTGDEKNKEIQIDSPEKTAENNPQKINIGNKIIISKNNLIDGSSNYVYIDSYRLPSLLLIFIIFVSLVLYFGKLKGLGSLFGLAFSILILRYFIVPQIAGGANPLLITVIGSVIVLSVSLYLAHGFNQRTNLSMLSTLITLGISIGLATFFVNISRLLGQGSEEAMFLTNSSLGNINLQGLLLAGIIIGTLGVLDDITTAQTSVVGELRLANPNLSKHELHKRALVVGKEHISSLVNTLVLAYAGASLPLFLLFSAYPDTPFWYSLNSQFISEEVVRTLVGSTALILAVPISTYIAAHFLSKTEVTKMKVEEFHGHHH